MLGLGDDDNKQLVGAKEKLARAKMIRKGMSPDEIKSKREGKGIDSPLPSIILIYLLSCVASFFLSRGPWKSGAPFDTGHPGIDDLFFDGGPLAISGDPSIDGGLTALVRGLPIFLAAGILPGLGFLWIRGLDSASMNPFRVVWGVTVGVIVAYFTFVEVIWPVIDLFL
jgi:hypothetical protein